MSEVSCGEWLGLALAALTGLFVKKMCGSTGNYFLQRVEEIGESRIGIPLCYSHPSLRAHSSLRVDNSELWWGLASRTPTS